ncbi:uncharacterized protein LOC105426098 [Pogonomyrmex barbatus]|uniref:Uncharacterized protein LOC105426098 n=1 Tax=Pogonomyrmex barbatus TaxID=144034 RepID=A0A6I9W5N3_9HYME|nr:uncharacterized protein LOC105426098 [Pogonomyrmex barbatus]
MGNLLDMRGQKSARTFLHCGVDYARLILVHLSAGRGYKARKANIALFISMTVRAIHLELVSDYSTDAFLAAYSRFCDRGGISSCLYSDNAKNFRGVDQELRSMWKAIQSDPCVLNKLAFESIQWKFIPPSAPHFGGLWEAGVRSVKFHLKRIVRNYTLTFEEMTTLLCKIEACLNSRPLALFSDDYEDYSALTPAHFLIGTVSNVS